MIRGLIGRPPGLPVVGWKYPPQGWWPELPGKAGKYNPPMAEAFKKLCRDCRKVEVKGKVKYCVSCKRSHHREAARRHKKRVRVDKLRNSLIGTEALTKPDLADGYGSSGHPNHGELSVGGMLPIL